MMALLTMMAPKIPPTNKYQGMDFTWESCGRGAPNMKDSAIKLHNPIENETTAA